MKSCSMIDYRGRYDASKRNPQGAQGRTLERRKGLYLDRHLLDSRNWAGMSLCGGLSYEHGCKVRCVGYVGGSPLCIWTPGVNTRAWENRKHRSHASIAASQAGSIPPTSRHRLTTAMRSTTARRKIGQAHESSARCLPLEQSYSWFIQKRHSCASGGAGH